APCAGFRDDMAFQRGLKAPANGLDFGQFGHFPYLAHSACPRYASVMSDPKTASFGFRDVPEAEKEGLVREVFSSVAARYDLMNDLMSAGIHRIWKDAMVEWLNPQPGWNVLDVAGGTGDIAFRIAEMARARNQKSGGGEAHITVCDIND